MIRDKENTFASNQTRTATGASDDIVDLKKAKNNYGIGTPMAVLITLRSAPDAGNADETYSAVLQVDDTSGFGSPTTVGPTATIPRTSAAGAKFAIPLPPDTSMEQYARVNFTLGGTTPSLNFDAELVPMSAIQNDAYYADALPAQP